MKALLISIAIGSCFTVSAQDVHSSNIQNLSQLYSPAFCALNNKMEASVFYRTQWKVIGSPFNAFGASFGTTVQPKRRSNKGYLAVGFNAYSEQLGQSSFINSVTASTTYHLRLGATSTVSVGLNMGVMTAEINPSSGTWESQHNGLVYDPTMSSGENFQIYQKNAFDAGSGFVYSLKSKKSKQNILQVGMAMFHLNGPDLSHLTNSSSHVPIRTVVHASSTLGLGPKGSFIQPSFLFQNQGKFNSLTIGAMAKIKLMEKAKSTSSFGKVNEIYAGFGFYVRTNDAVILNASIQKSNWTASLAYDFTTSMLNEANNSRGALEVQLMFVIPSFVKGSRY